MSEFRRGLSEALPNVESQHLLDRDAFKRHLQNQAASVPPCMKGLDACGSPKAAAFDAAGLENLVRLRLESTDDGVKATYRLLDRRGRVAREGTVRADGPRQLGFAVVRAIFDATGSVSITTQPSGATVIVDGENVGTTPLDTRLSVGTHNYSIELEGYRTVEGGVEVTSSGSDPIRHDLEPMQGTLIVEGAPEGATVFVDGKEVGPASDELPIAPGNHTLKVTAKNYEPLQTTVSVEAGQTVTKTAALQRVNPLLQSVDADQIANNKYFFRLSYDQSIHRTTFRDSRGEVGGTTYEFLGFAEGNQLPDELQKRTIGPPGLRVDLGYTGRNLGVVALSLSYHGVAQSRQAILTSDPGGDSRVQATVNQVHRLHLRPLQLKGRLIFNNFVPTAEIGTGIAFQWVEAEFQQQNDTRNVTLTQTEAYWTMGAGLEYYFSPNWFAMFRYSFQDYFNAGRGVEHMLSFGFGGAFANVFGIEPEPPEEL
jgi:opacity protein-like surface antigen